MLILRDLGRLQSWRLLQGFPLPHSPQKLGQSRVPREGLNLKRDGLGLRRIPPACSSRLSFAVPPLGADVLRPSHSLRSALRNRGRRNPGLSVQGQWPPRCLMPSGPRTRPNVFEASPSVRSTRLSIRRILMFAVSSLAQAAPVCGLTTMVA